MDVRESLYNARFAHSPIPIGGADKGGKASEFNQPVIVSPHDPENETCACRTEKRRAMPPPSPRVEQNHHGGKDRKEAAYTSLCRGINGKRNAE